MLPHLAASDPASSPVVERLHEEHEVIAGLLELEGTETLSTMLLFHLRHEDTELRHSLATHGMHVG